ncbi:MAG: AAA family ATPase [Coriobacteriia bacterium]|nr:AAA family ATPase [Coriobacteriia bacterium]
MFDRVWGQPKVREFFRTAVAAGKVGQSYLFCGPAGSGKQQAALAVAAALMCPQGGCDVCPVCRKTLREKHPDVRVYAPEGAAGYLVSQIREIVADVALAPIQANQKIYILNRADLLGAASANAFLKTLEEPPANVTIILLARTRDSVLPTILSRCQVVPFRHIPESEAVGLVCQNATVAPERAQAALAACDGSVQRAASFAASNEMMAFRRRILDVLAQLRKADDWDILGFSERLILDAKAPLDGIKADQELELEQNADFLGNAARKQIEARNKRLLTAKGAELLGVVTAVVRSWLRDVTMLCAEQPALVTNTDAQLSLQDAAAHTNEARCVRAYGLVQESERALAYNVSPQTCIDVLLLDMREVLYDPDCTG